MLGLLVIGQVHGREDREKGLFLPESEEVLKYLERMDFFRFAKKYFRLEPFETPPDRQNG